MSDYLVEFGQNKTAKKVVKNLGFNLPHKLTRLTSPWSPHFMGSQSVGIGGKGRLHLLWGESLTRAGAFLSILSQDEQVVAAYANLSQIKVHNDGKLVKMTNVLLFDATGFDKVDDLGSLYSFFHQNIRLLSANGRILIVGWDVSQGSWSPEQAAVQEGLEGFLRSIAKEVGKRGATANMIACSQSDVILNRSVAVMQFLLSPRAAFVSGQVLRVGASVGDDPKVQWQNPLAGKTALVTGAARGIGRATAEALAREGAHVICLDRPDDEKPLAETSLKISGKILLQDITADDAAEKIRTFVREHSSGLDIIVHNAGVTRDKTIANMDQDRWNLAIDVNLRAVVHITEQLLKDGLNDQARIICLSSIAGIAGNFGQTNYATAKSALIGYIRAMAALVAPRGMTINGVAPGFIETRLTENIPFFTREVARRLCNLSQGGLPQDVAEAITFLATPQSVGLNGQVVRVCGGSLVGR